MVNFPRCSEGVKNHLFPYLFPRWIWFDHVWSRISIGYMNQQQQYGYRWICLKRSDVGHSASANKHVNIKAESYDTNFGYLVRHEELDRIGQSQNLGCPWVKFPYVFHGCPTPPMALRNQQPSWQQKSDSHPVDVLGLWKMRQLIWAIERLSATTRRQESSPSDSPITNRPIGHPIQSFHNPIVHGLSNPIIQ